MPCLVSVKYGVLQHPCGRLFFWEVTKNDYILPDFSEGWTATNFFLFCFYGLHSTIHASSCCNNYVCVIVIKLTCSGGTTYYRSATSIVCSGGAPLLSAVASRKYVWFIEAFCSPSESLIFNAPEWLQLYLKLFQLQSSAILIVQVFHVF